MGYAGPHPRPIIPYITFDNPTPPRTLLHQMQHYVHHPTPNVSVGNFGAGGRRHAIPPSFGEAGLGPAPCLSCSCLLRQARSILEP